MRDFRLIYAAMLDNEKPARSQHLTGQIFIRFRAIEAAFGRSPFNANGYNPIAGDRSSSAYSQVERTDSNGYFWSQWAVRPY